MTFTAFLLILLSVLLHVSWNLMSKAQRPSAAFYCIVSVDAALVTAPFLLTGSMDWGGLGPVFWRCFGFSVAANIGYYTGLFLAYQRSDISLAYPLARALPVLLTALATLVFGIGTAPSKTALLGMLVVFAGCLLMPLPRWSDFSWRNYATPALGAILLAGCGTTAYTIFDSISIPIMNRCAAGHLLHASGIFLFMLELAVAIGLSGFLLFSRKERQAFRELIRSPLPHLSGVFTAGAYFLVLLAMPMVTNVSFVQAFRQMGLPVGVLAAMFLLKEKCPPVRFAGMLIIVTGLILTAAG